MSLYSIKSHRKPYFYLTIFLVILLVSAFFPLDQLILNIGSYKINTICIFKILTGSPCLTCGLTRSFCSLSRFDLYKAFDYHPLGPILYLYCLILLIGFINIAAGGKDFFVKSKVFRGISVVFISSGLLMTWVLRILSIL